MQTNNLKKPITLLTGKHSLFRIEKILFALLLLLLCDLASYSQQFTVYNTWDFESETLGAYDSAAIIQDFNTTVVRDHDAGSIVMDTINGTPTKVLQVYHEANRTGQGFQVFAKIPDSDWNEVYLSYNMKFGKEFNSTAGGKIPGLAAFPDYVSGNCPVSGQGFGGVNLFKRAGWTTTYHYDNTLGWCPWSGDEHDYMTDTIYMVNGVWYNITQRYVVNSFVNGTPQEDGIRELWINGKMTHQLNDLVLMLDDEDSMKIDEIHISNFYGGSGTDYEPVTDCYAYFDNFKTFIPGDDSIINYELHHPSTILPTPDEIANRTFYYDSLRTTTGTLSNMQYGGNYSAGRDETFLIDAGAGNTVSFNITAGEIGGGDYLFFYDGNTTDAELIDMVIGYKSSFTGIRESTGRYMFVRFSVDTDGGGGSSWGWTGTVSFSGTPTPPNPPTNLHVTDSTSSSISMAWTDSNNEDKFIIERSLSAGSGFAAIDSVGTNVTTYTNTGLSPETTYYYRVKAKNSAGESTYSNVLGVTTPETVDSDTTLVCTIKTNFTMTGYTGVNEWNDFLNYSSGSSISLDDSLDNSTGYTLYNEDSWSYPNSIGELTGPYPEDVNRTYWYIQSNECDLELRNLDDDNLYTIEAYASRDNPGVTRETRVTIGSDFDIITVNDNTSDKAIFPYVSPSSGVIRIAFTPETDIYAYVNALVVKEYEVSSDTTINDTIAQINFMPSGYSETGWVNVRHYSADYPADLGDGMSLSMSGTLSSNNTGEPSTIFPSNVGSTFCFITADNETPVVFTVSGLDTTKAYAFDFFASRDDAVSGDRTTYFSIGDDTVSIDALGNTDSLLTISAVSPNSAGNITINMFRPTGQYGYINAMFIWDIGEKSASISKDDDNKEKLNETEIKVYPNPGSTMITIAGFDKAIEIKIVDMLGKVVYQKGYAAKSTRVDISNLKKGLYLIMLKTESNYHLKKFIKN